MPTKKITKKVQTLIATLDEKGLRLDHWLVIHFPEKSRSAWQKQIKQGNVRLNHASVSSNATLKEGDTIKIRLQTPSSTLKGENIPLDIVFEDKNYAVINKPAGLVVHPGAGHQGHTLVHALLYHFKKNLSKTNDSDRPGIVHRLDKDTSGLLMVAKNDMAHRFLTEQFEKKEVQKIYTTLVEGHVTPTRGSIEAPLSRGEKNRIQIQVTQKGDSRYALTHYEVEKRFNNPIPCSLLKVRIETGRTHQIRVHFKSIGHSVLGDALYTKPSLKEVSEALGLTRQFLHAAELSFISPTTKKRVHYKSELPKDLKQALKKLS
ncbi:MAG: RluA family pseudouridine synthase [Candidatus Gracilibacteria bacterium]